MKLFEACISLTFIQTHTDLKIHITRARVQLYPCYFAAQSYIHIGVVILYSYTLLIVIF